MAFDVKTNISDIFTQKSCCYISELPSYILSHSPINHALNPFERQIYALVQTRCHYGNYRLSLRTYLFNGCNGSFTYLNELLPESWQSISFNRSLKIELLTLLLDKHLIFLGRPSLRNTQLITIDSLYNHSDLIEVLAVCRSPLMQEFV